MKRLKLNTKKELTETSWENNLFNIIKKHKINFLPYVPDAGHAKLISLLKKIIL